MRTWLEMAIYRKMMMLMSTNVQNELLDPLVLPTLPFTSHSTLIFCLYIPLGCCMQNSKSLELKISAAQARSQSNLSLVFFRVFSLLLVLADIIIVIVDLATEAQSEKVNKIPVKNLKNLADFMTSVTCNQSYGQQKGICLWLVFTQLIKIASKNFTEEH